MCNLHSLNIFLKGVNIILYKLVYIEKEQWRNGYRHISTVSTMLLQNFSK